MRAPVLLIAVLFAASCQWLDETLMPCADDLDCFDGWVCGSAGDDGRFCESSSGDDDDDATATDDDDATATDDDDSTPAFDPTELGLGGVALWLFANTEDGSDADIGATGEWLASLLHEHDEALADYDNFDARTFIVPILDGESLTVDIGNTADPADQRGTSVGFRSDWPVSDHIPHMALLDQSPVQSDQGTYERAFSSDPSAFVVGDASFLRAEDAREIDSLLFTIGYTQQRQLRRTTLPDGNPMVVTRGWTEARAPDGNGSAISQWHDVDVYVEDEGGTLRFRAVWFEIESAAPVGDNIILDLVSSSIDQAFTNTEVWFQFN